MTTASAEAAYPPAGLERRFLAFTLDRLVAWTAYAGLAWLAWWLFWSDGATWAGVGVLAGGVLVVSGGLAVLAGLTGLSPGRAATGLRLVDASSGEPLGVGRALLRALLLGLATIPTFGFGVATLAWTALSDPGRRRRGWHDRRVGSEVVDVRPVEEEDEELIHEVPRQMVNLTAMRLVPSGPAAPHAAPQQQAPPQPAPQQSPPDQPSPPREPGSPRPGAPDPRTPAPRTPDPAAPGPSPSPPRQQLQGPLRPDPEPDAPDAPEAPAARTSPANAAPGGTAVAAGSTPAGTVIPSDRSDRSERPGRHRGRDRGRGRNAPEPPEPPAPPRWKVTFDTGEGFVVEGVVLVGRRPEARPGERVSRAVALPSQDMSLSKTHAQLHLADGVLVVMDRGSTNGSVLNRKGVARDLAPNRPTTLVDGDRVRFGDREMRVEKAG